MRKNKIKAPTRFGGCLFQFEVERQIPIYLRIIHIFISYNKIIEVFYLNKKMKYWTSVIKNFAIFLLTLVLIFLFFKLAVFYIPFLIGFIISLLIEPLIKKVANKTGFARKTSAIIVLIILFTLLYP